MAVASISSFRTVLSSEMTTNEVYREFCDPAMTFIRPWSRVQIDSFLKSFDTGILVPRGEFLVGFFYR